MALTTVFLDLGNTLLAERHPRPALYAEEGRRQGLTVSAAQMEVCMRSALASLPREIDGAFRYSDDWFRAFQRRIFLDDLGLPSTRFEELSERIFARFEAADTFALFPGVHELLEALRARGLRLGLISNWSERLPRLLAALDLAQAFDFVLGSAQLRLEKPASAIFRKALDLARAEPATCLHAGDDLVCDARGALDSGIAAVLVDHPGRFGPVERALCPVVRDLPELRDLILGMP